MSTKKLIFIGSVLAILYGVGTAVLVSSIFEDKKTIKESHARELKEQNLNSTCSYKRDSLQREVEQLSIYKSLTKSMVFRDEATKLLPHKVGDIIITKNDSVKGVIEDIIIGGSKYNFYVKYKVLLKDNTIREIVPELIY